MKLIIPSNSTGRLSLLFILFAGVALFAPALSAATTEDAAKEIATIYRAARKVISDNQALINDAEKGDKGLGAAVVVAKMKENYKAAAGKDLAEADTATFDGRARGALTKAVTEVMDQAQPLINEKGKGFKGFLPAVFARQVAENFSEKMQGAAFIKLTAPRDYLRNRANRPDEWESDVMEKKFRSSSWVKGAVFAEKGEHRGKEGYRLILPEYYGQSCLACHGKPRGELDITGGKKEGAELDELGGAISVVIYGAK